MLNSKFCLQAGLWADKLLVVMLVMLRADVLAALVPE